jgi:hypothetical protein
MLFAGKSPTPAASGGQPAIQGASVLLTLEGAYLVVCQQPVKANKRLPELQLTANAVTPSIRPLIQYSSNVRRVSFVFP